eukprot:364821-Chlamydomonas_euryale.AAC.11
MSLLRREAPHAASYTAAFPARWIRSCTACAAQTADRASDSRAARRGAGRHGVWSQAPNAPSPPPPSSVGLPSRDACNAQTGTRSTAQAAATASLSAQRRGGGHRVRAAVRAPLPSLWRGGKRGGERDERGGRLVGGALAAALHRGMCRRRCCRCCCRCRCRCYFARASCDATARGYRDIQRESRDAAMGGGRSPERVLAPARQRCSLRCGRRRANAARFCLPPDAQAKTPADNGGGGAARAAPTLTALREDNQRHARGCVFPRGAQAARLLAFGRARRESWLCTTEEGAGRVVFFRRRSVCGAAVARQPALTAGR